LDDSIIAERHAKKAGDFRSKEEAIDYWETYFTARYGTAPSKESALRFAVLATAGKSADLSEEDIEDKVVEYESKRRVRHELYGGRSGQAVTVGGPFKEADSAYAELRSQVEEMGRRISEDRAKMGDYESNIKALTGKLAESEKKAVGYENYIEMIVGTKTELENKAAEYDANIKTLNARLTESEKNATEKDANLKNTQDQLAALRSELENQRKVQPADGKGQTDGALQSSEAPATPKPQTDAPQKEPAPYLKTIGGGFNQEYDEAEVKIVHDHVSEQLKAIEEYGNPKVNEAREKLVEAYAARAAGKFDAAFDALLDAQDGIADYNNSKYCAGLQEVLLRQINETGSNTLVTGSSMPPVENSYMRYMAGSNMLKEGEYGQAEDAFLAGFAALEEERRTKEAATLSPQPVAPPKPAVAQQDASKYSVSIDRKLYHLEEKLEGMDVIDDENPLVKRAKRNLENAKRAKEEGRMDDAHGIAEFAMSDIIEYTTIVAPKPVAPPTPIAQPAAPLADAPAGADGFFNGNDSLLEALYELSIKEAEPPAPRLPYSRVANTILSQLRERLQGIKSDDETITKARENLTVAYKEINDGRMKDAYDRLKVTEGEISVWKPEEAKVIDAKVEELKEMVKDREIEQGKSVQPVKVRMPKGEKVPEMRPGDWKLIEGEQLKQILNGTGSEYQLAVDQMEEYGIPINGDAYFNDETRKEGLFSKKPVRRVTGLYVRNGSPAANRASELLSAAQAVKDGEQRVEKGIKLVDRLFGRKRMEVAERLDYPRAPPKPETAVAPVVQVPTDESQELISGVLDETIAAENKEKAAEAKADKDSKFMVADELVSEYADDRIAEYL